MNKVIFNLENCFCTKTVFNKNKNHPILKIIKLSTKIKKRSVTCSPVDCEADPANK